MAEKSLRVGGFRPARRLLEQQTEERPRGEPEQEQPGQPEQQQRFSSGCFRPKTVMNAKMPGFLRKPG